MRLGVVFLLFALAIGCGHPAAGPSNATASPTPVPWLAARAEPTLFPIPTPTPRPTGVRTCAASDLIGRYDGGQGAGGWITRGFLIGNRSTTPCVAEGPTRAAYLDADGREIVARSIDPGSLNAGWVVLDALTEPVDGSPRREGQAYIGLATYGDCGPAPVLAAVALTFAEPSDRVVIPMAPARVGGRCDVPEERLELGVFFALAPVPTPPPPATQVPEPLALSIEAPPTAVAGADLTYTLRIRNSTSQPYFWNGGCPLYIEWLSGRDISPTHRPSAGSKPEDAHPLYIGGVKEVHPLNCLAAGPIQPGAEVAFEIRIRVPSDARGPDTLRFEIISELPRGSASSAIVIN